MNAVYKASIVNYLKDFSALRFGTQELHPRVLCFHLHMFVDDWDLPSTGVLFC